MTLSKSKDGFLFILGCASETDYYITDWKGQKQHYIISGGHIDGITLSRYTTGIYDLLVSYGDCEVAGDIKLTITD